MKSKSFQIKGSPKVKSKHNKTYDFIGLYPTAAETHAKLSEKRKSAENVITETSYHPESFGDTPKGESNTKSKKGKNEPVEVSKIHINGQSLGPKHTSTPARGTPVSDPTATLTNKARTGTLNVKSIMKNSTTNDDTMDGSSVDVYTYKPKKRNKSVSFMLEDHEEVAIKKTKSDDSIQVDAKIDKKTSKRDKINMKKNLKKLKKNFKEAEKENKKNNIDTDQINSQVKENQNAKPKKDKTQTIGKPQEDTAKPVGTDTALNTQVEKKKKNKKNKKRKQIENDTEPTENENNSNDQSEPKLKKLKKKKHNLKVQVSDTTETEEEPATKGCKREPKADIITEDLENLSIGDNAHTLTNLLDDMTVVDKDKKKKNKVKRKKGKGTTPSASSSDTADLEKIEEGKEKIKWNKRKWNKDRKGNADDNLENIVIVDNLPLSLMLSYKKVLAEHFAKLGLVKKIGIAEVYPTEESKPVFTTTIIFYSDGAAMKALEEDNTLVCGARVRVRPALPATQTTLVLRSYGELTEQAVCSVFSGAGRIRNIRHLVKGRKAMATAFIEFDGPEAVERAIKMAEDAKIGGKKIHVSKFDQRRSKRNATKEKNNEGSENEGDSEDSND